jgi:5,10-methylenetetrahydrofolate reductase
MDAGATRALGQFCFDNDATARFRDDAARAGITIPIVPGIMPTTNFKGVVRMAAKTIASIPNWLAAPMMDWTKTWKAAALSPPPCWPTRCSSCAPAASASFISIPSTRPI